MIITVIGATADLGLPARGFASVLLLWWVLAQGVAQGPVFSGVCCVGTPPAAPSASYNCCLNGTSCSLVLDVLLDRWAGNKPGGIVSHLHPRSIHTRHHRLLLLAIAQRFCTAHTKTAGHYLRRAAR